MAAGRLEPSGPDDRRGEKRNEILSDLRAEIMVYQPMSVRQISQAGVLVLTTSPLHIDSLHDVRLGLGPASIVVKTRVIHCAVVEMDGQQLSYRAGLEFVEPSAGVHLAVAQFIDALKSAEWRSDSDETPIT